MVYNIVQEYDDTRYVKAVVYLDDPWHEYWQPGLGNGSIGCEYMVWPWDSEIGSIEFEWEEVKPVYGNYSNGGVPWYDELDWEQESLGGGWSGPDVGGSNYVGINRYRVRARITRNDVRYDWAPWSSVVDDHCTYGDNCVHDAVTKFCVKGDYDERLSEFAAAHIRMPYVFGSHWSHQVLRWVAADCADMVAHAMGLASQEKEQETGQTGNATVFAAGTPNPEPSAQHLYDWAVAGSYGLSLRRGDREKQKLTIQFFGTAGGTYTLTFKGATTAPLSVFADSSAIQSALNGLPTLSGVTVEDLSPPGVPGLEYGIIFEGEENEPQVTADGSQLIDARARTSIISDGHPPYPQHGDIVVLWGDIDHAIVVVDGPTDTELSTSHTIIHASGRNDKCEKIDCPEGYTETDHKILTFTS